MDFSITDYVPHGMVAAFAGVVTYVFRDHVKQDDARFNEIKEDLKTLVEGQGKLAQVISDNHAEVLKLFISAGQHADALEVLSKARDAH